MKKLLTLVALALVAGCSTEPSVDSASVKLSFNYKRLIPTGDSLAPVYPNPFSREAGDTSIMIHFMLRDSGSAVVLIQNALGDEVASFSDSTLPPGEYLGPWKPFGSDGTPVMAGVYFVTLRAGDIINSRLVSIQDNE